MEQKNTLSPEPIWKKLLKLDKARFNAQEEEAEKGLRHGKLFKVFENKEFTILKSIVKADNAEEVYLFLLRQDTRTGGYFFANAKLLQIIEEAVADEPYAENIFAAVMQHPEFDDASIFPENAQLALLKMPALLTAYWNKGHDLCDKAEIALFNLPNCEQLLHQYLSYDYGLCAEAQKKLLAMPDEKKKKLLAKFIGGINEKNYGTRMLCQRGLFTLLKEKILFDLYVEKMSPFFKERKAIFPTTIAFVAKRKGWL